MPLLQEAYSLSVIEFDALCIAVVLSRNRLIGHPYTYHLQLATALDQPCYAQFDAQGELREILEQVRAAYDARCYAWALAPSRLNLVLRHVPSTEDDDRLRQRWRTLGGSARIPATRLRARMDSLGCLMQTLAQRTSQAWHRRHGTRGHLWAGRYRACLLADDAALLVACACCERLPGAVVASGRTGDADDNPPPYLAPLPIRSLPGGMMVPADEAQLGLPHPLPDAEGQLMPEFVAQIESALPSYMHALEHGWALGRPESLTECVGRLGRTSGRGRSRQVRELDDELGLCGVWG